MVQVISIKSQDDNLMDSDQNNFVSLQGTRQKEEVTLEVLLV